MNSLGEDRNHSPSPKREKNVNTYRMEIPLSSAGIVKEKAIEWDLANAKEGFSPLIPKEWNDMSWQ